MDSIGLDIGSYAIKVVTGTWKGKTFQVTQALECPNPAGTLFPADPQMQDKLQKTLQAFFTEQKLPTRGIKASLPESVVVTKIITMPQLSEAELASAIHWQVEQHIPIPLEELQYEYTILRHNDTAQEKTMDILIVGVQQKLVKFLTDFFLNVNLDVQVLETDTLAQLRTAETLLNTDDPQAFLHIGAQTSTVSIVADKTLQFVYSFSIAGFLLTRAIEQAIHLDAGRAEEYKRSYGLLADKAEGKVRAALLPVTQSLVGEVQKAFQYFTSQHQGKTITRLSVNGGSLYLPDLLPFLSQALAVEVVPIRLQEMQAFTWAKPVSQDSRFTTALGLAMKKE